MQIRSTKVEKRKTEATLSVQQQVAPVSMVRDCVLDPLHVTPPHDAALHDRVRVIDPDCVAHVAPLIAHALYSRNKTWWVS